MSVDTERLMLTPSESSAHCGAVLCGGDAGSHTHTHTHAHGDAERIKRCRELSLSLSLSLTHTHTHSHTHTPTSTAVLCGGEARRIKLCQRALVLLLESGGFIRLSMH